MESARSEIRTNGRLRTVLLRVVVAMTVACGAVVATTATSATPVHADFHETETLRTSSFEASLNIQARQFKVTERVTIRHNKPDQGSIFFVLREARSVLPLLARDVSVTVEGRASNHSPVGGESLFDVIEFDLGRDLLFGQSASFTVSYSIPIPRSEIANAAYFDVSTLFVFFDDGQLTLRFPAGFNVTAKGERGMRKSRDGGRPVFQTNLEFIDPITPRFEGTKDAALAKQQVKVDKTSVTLRGWPGERKWMRDAKSTVKNGLQSLSNGSGHDLPKRSFTITRRNISGTKQPQGGKFEMGAEVNPRPLIEQLAPPMFDGEFEQQWINAGLAKTFTEQAIATSDPDVIASSPTTPNGESQLNDWSPKGKLSQPTNPGDEAAFDASWYVVNSLYDELGSDELKKVLDATKNGTTAYPVKGNDGGKNGAKADDWQRLLDQAEVAGSKSIGENIAQYVVTDEQADALSARAEARQAYDKLADGSKWQIPPVIRNAMDGWDFDMATNNIGTANKILENRGELTEVADDLGVNPPSVKDDFESETDDLGDVQKRVEDGLDTAKEIEYAAEVADEGRGLVERIGLMGTDLDAKLDDAKNAFEDANFEAARDAADDLVATADDAGSTGMQRVLLVLGLIVVIAAAIVVLVMVRRRRRHVEPGTAPPTAPSAAPAPTQTEPAMYGAPAAPTPPPLPGRGDMPPPPPGGPGGPGAPPPPPPR